MDCAVLWEMKGKKRTRNIWVFLIFLWNVFFFGVALTVANCFSDPGCFFCSETFKLWNTREYFVLTSTGGNWGSLSSNLTAPCEFVWNSFKFKIDSKGRRSFCDGQTAYLTRGTLRLGSSVWRFQENSFLSARGILYPNRESIRQSLQQHKSIGCQEDGSLWRRIGNMQIDP